MPAGFIRAFNSGYWKNGDNIRKRSTFLLNVSIRRRCVCICVCVWVSFTLVETLQVLILVTSWLVPRLFASCICLKWWQYSERRSFVLGHLFWLDLLVSCDIPIILVSPFVTLSTFSRYNGIITNNQRISRYVYSKSLFGLRVRMTNWIATLSTSKSTTLMGHSVRSNCSSEMCARSCCFGFFTCFVIISSLILSFLFFFSLSLFLMITIYKIGLKEEHIQRDNNRCVQRQMLLDILFDPE